MDTQPYLQQLFTDTHLGLIKLITPVSGGCINQAFKVTLSDERSFFCKTHPSAPTSMFPAEAKGLQALRNAGEVYVPKVVLIDQHCLVLEYIPPQVLKKKYWATFGQQLAQLHGHTSEQFGFDSDNFCGLTPQPNPLTDDGYAFFAEHRLLNLGSQLYDQRSLSKVDLDHLERLCKRLPNIIPRQPASLIHGDLWSGNAFHGPNGEPALIDPATHYGWAEAELAMTLLFGGFPSDFYEAYEECSIRDNGWRKRADIYNLYHLLNHLLLFGESYLPQVRSILKKYA